LSSLLCHLVCRPDGRLLLSEPDHGWGVFSRDVVTGGAKPFEESELRLAKVSEDRLFGLVLLPTFLPILVNGGKGAN
jgi:hypothetical protein